MNKSKILYLFTRTPLHVGAGASVGAIDQPVQRERHTGFPIIPGSSVKGVLRDHLRTLGLDAINDLFGRGGAGEDFSAGKISFGEARLLAFPVRSAKGAFALATSPLALQRFARDAGLEVTVPPPPADMTCLAGSKLVIEKNGQKGAVLEEFRFKVTDPFPVKWEAVLTNLKITDCSMKRLCLRKRFFMLHSPRCRAVRMPTRSSKRWPTSNWFSSVATEPRD